MFCLFFFLTTKKQQYNNTLARTDTQAGTHMTHAHDTRTCVRTHAHAHTQARTHRLARTHTCSHTHAHRTARMPKNACTKHTTKKRSLQEHRCRRVETLMTLGARTSVCIRCKAKAVNTTHKKTTSIYNKKKKETNTQWPD